MLRLSPRPNSTAADLLRLAAAWLAGLLLLQALAAALALAHGPLHRHRTPLWTLPSLHQHQHYQQHQHDLQDGSVQTAATPDTDQANAEAVLAAVIALWALARLGLAADTRRHVWRAARTWVALSADTWRWQRPPRLG